MFICHYFSVNKNLKLEGYDKKIYIYIGITLRNTGLHKQRRYIYFLKIKFVYKFLYAFVVD